MLKRLASCALVVVPMACQDPLLTPGTTALTAESGDADSSVGMMTSAADSTTNGDGATTTTTTADTTCAAPCESTGESSTTQTSVDTTGTTTTADDSSSSGVAEETTDTGVDLCGNGAIDGNEECDDAGESAVCNADCSFSMCPDGVFNATAGEECDAGGESLACDGDCSFPVCGDGVVNESDNEVCDASGESPTCDANCTPVECGDGTQNLAALETCDDGDNDSGDGCSSACVIEGDFGGVCRIVDGRQWCFDNDHCGEACNDVCGRLGLTIEPNDATWFGAQDSAFECQAISDAFGVNAPVNFGADPLACLEDGGLSALTGGGLTGALTCSSDPACPAAHRNDMNDIGTGCDLPDARRSVCLCAGEFCGNGVVEGAEVCDDGNQIQNDGCTTSCLTTPPTCVVVNNQQWCFDNEACGEACNDVCDALGLPLGISDDEWLAAQDTVEECQAISNAFGIFEAIQLGAFTYACMEDFALADQVGGGLTGTLYCSTDVGCPGQHRTNMDNLGQACGDPSARRSICPCG